jgi:segregation and condensation protein B
MSEVIQPEIRAAEETAAESRGGGAAAPEPAPVRRADETDSPNPETPAETAAPQSSGLSQEDIAAPPNGESGEGTCESAPAVEAGAASEASGALDDVSAASAQAEAARAEAAPGAERAGGVSSQEAAPEEQTVVDAAELLGESTAAAAPTNDERALQRAMVEAAIYITEEPLTLEQLVMAMELPKERIQEILAELVETYSAPTHGVTIREIAGGYKMATKPEHHERIRAFVKKLKPPLKLSLAALETLAVIAYKQPITAPEIMEIRGVQGAGVLKTLIDRKLITPAGRKQVVGKPILYKTTKEFLVQFGLKDLSELPTLKEFEELRRLAFNDDEPQSEATAANSSSATAAPAAGGMDAPPAADAAVAPGSAVEAAEASGVSPSAEDSQPESRSNEPAAAVSE